MPNKKSVGTKTKKWWKWRDQWHI